LIIPKKIPIKALTNNLYSIQVGHFNKKESMNIVSEQLSDVIGYPLISKEFSNGKYKLFLGTFKTPQEAKEALNRLKRRYRKNRYINEAFITQLPR
jgi:cell division septation protein DedD